MNATTKIKNLMKRTTGSLLLVLYATICLVAHFPILHNHNLLETKNCCQSNDSCSKGVNYSDFSQMSLDSSDHPEKPACVACLWQAMAKKNRCVFQAKEFSLHEIEAAPVLSDGQLYQCNVYLLPESRAPPVS